MRLVLRPLKRMKLLKQTHHGIRFIGTNWKHSKPDVTSGVKETPAQEVERKYKEKVLKKLIETESAKLDEKSDRGISDAAEERLFTELSGSPIGQQLGGRISSGTKDKFGEKKIKDTTGKDSEAEAIRKLEAKFGKSED